MKPPRLRRLLASFVLSSFISMRPPCQPPTPLAKAPAAVTGLSLPDDGTALAVADAASVCIRGQDDRALAELPLAGVRFLDFAKELGSGGLLFAALSSDGGLSVWDLRGSGAAPAGIAFLDEDGGEAVLDSRYTALAFSPDSDYLAAGGEDGQVRLFFKLRHTRRFLVRKLEGLTGRIVSLAFSPNSRYLAAASEDGNALLWDCSSLSAVADVPFYVAQSDMPLSFSDGGLLAVALDARSVVLYDMAGGQQGSLIVEGDIKEVRFLPGTTGADTAIAVLTAEGELFFYNMASGEPVASVPAAAAAPRTAFTFSADGSFLYEGYGDGSVFRLPLAKAMQPQGPTREQAERLPAGGRPLAGGQQAVHERRPPQEEKPAALPSGAGPSAAPTAAAPAPGEEEAAARASPGTEAVAAPAGSGQAAAQDGSGGRWQPTTVIPSGRNSLAVYAGGASLQAPYDAAVRLDVSCRIGSFLPPFYVGAGLEGQLGFCLDAEDFPYEYTWHGEPLDPPMTEGLSLYLPLGVQYDLGNSCGVFGELHAGVRELMLWRPYDEGIFTSGIHFVPMAGMYMGALFHGLTVQLGVDFDPVQRFMPALLLGYSITLPGGGRQ